MRMELMGLLRQLRWPYFRLQWSRSHTRTSPIHDSKPVEADLQSEPGDQNLTSPDLPVQNGSSTEPLLSPVLSSTAALQLEASNTSQQQQAVSTSPKDSPHHAEDSAMPSLDHTPRFRDDGIPLPDSSKKLFLSISPSSPTWSNEEYEERFEFVTRELIRAVAEHGQLRSSGRFNTYSLHMIGTSPNTASPHILIGCRRSDLDALQDLFYNYAADRLYCFKDSTWDKIFKSKSNPPRPSFKLFFLHTPQDPVRRYASLLGGEAVVSLRFSDETLCGALVKHQGRMATVGLVLDVDGVSHLITVKHLFDNDKYKNGDFDNPHRSKSNWDYLLQMMTDLKAEAAKVQNWASFGLSGLHPYSTSMFSRAVQRKTSVVEVRVVDSTSLLPARVPDLDWAVLKLQRCALKHPLLNVIFPTAPSSQVHLKHISQSPRYHGVPVYMVSGIEGLRKGHLFKGVTYLGPEPDYEPCGVWTMALNSLQGLIPGECGSIVVDQETFEVYGHVIGSNILENVYVVPFSQTARQIQDTFNVSTVCLPKPQPLALELTVVVSGENHACMNKENREVKAGHIIIAAFVLDMLFMLVILSNLILINVILAYVTPAYVTPLSERDFYFYIQLFLGAFCVYMSGLWFGMSSSCRICGHGGSQQFEEQS